MPHVFYSPELQVPPMDPECNVTFSFIVSKEERDEGKESERVTFVSGLNRNIDPEHWEKILEKEAAISMLKVGALRVVETDEPEVLKPEDLNMSPGDVKLEDLTPKDAVEAISKLHDIRLLNQLMEKELRTPVRTALTRRIGQLSS